MTPDAVGQVSFVNVERRMRENNLQILAIEQSVLTIEDIDYDKLYDKLWHQLNELAQAQWAYVRAGSMMRAISNLPAGQRPPGMEDVEYSDYEYNTTFDQLDRAYDAVREQFDAIKDGDMQADNAETIRQLHNLQNQIVMAGEATYIALSAMEVQKEGLERQLTALDRKLTEMELRYQLGHISSNTLKQAQAGRSALSSGLDTLRMNLNTYKGQLELLIGAEISGGISLGALPAVAREELEAMNLELDLETAKVLIAEYKRTRGKKEEL